MDEEEEHVVVAEAEVAEAAAVEALASTADRKVTSPENAQKNLRVRVEAADSNNNDLARVTNAEKKAIMLASARKDKAVAAEEDLAAATKESNATAVVNLGTWRVIACPVATLVVAASEAIKKSLAVVLASLVAK